MKIVPFRDQMLIKPKEKDGALTPLMEEGMLCEYGTIVALGGDVTEFSVGDNIGFMVWGLNTLDIDGTKHYFVRCSPEFVLGKIVEGE